MRKYFITLLLFFSTSALAIDTFDGATNILDIDAVVVDRIQYNDVVLKLNAFEVIIVGSSLPIADGTVTEDSFDEATNILNINTVIVAGIQYNNVFVRLDAFDIISIGSSIPISDGTVTEICSEANLSWARYNAINVGMTLDQVNQTLGCKYSSGPQQTRSGYSYSWGAVYTNILVGFHSSDNLAFSKTRSGVRAR